MDMTAIRQAHIILLNQLNERPKAKPIKQCLSEMYELEIAKPSELKKLKEPYSYNETINQ